MIAEKIRITDHALLRWKQRASIYGNEGVEVIKDCLLASRFIPEGETFVVPWMRRSGGSCYYWSQERECYFVGKVEGNVLSIITIITPKVGVGMAEPFWLDETAGIDDRIAALAKRRGMIAEEMKRCKGVSAPDRLILKGMGEELDAKLETLRRLKREGKPVSFSADPPWVAAMREELLSLRERVVRLETMGRP